MPGVHVFYTRTHARAHAYMCACDNVLYIYIFMSWAEMHCSLTHSQGIHTLNMYAVRMTTFARMRLKLLRVTAPYGNQHAGNIVAGCSNESSRSVSAWNLTEDVYEGAGNVKCTCVFMRPRASVRFKANKYGLNNVLLNATIANAVYGDNTATKVHILRLEFNRDTATMSDKCYVRT